MGTPSSQIDETAAVWALRTQDGALTAAQDVELQDWLQADPRHLGAYTKAMGVLAHFDQAAALKTAPAIAARTTPGFQPSRRGWLVGGGAVAAGVAGALVFGEWALHFRGRTSTRKGEVRMIALQDGSQIALDTSSVVQIAFSPRHRDVRLIRGEALFDVAKDTQRPFVVFAGDTRVRAVGTSFSVRRLPNAPVQVLVREGLVEVTHQPAGKPPQALKLSANMTVQAIGAAPMIASVASPEDVDRKLAWRSGMIDFDTASLSEAAAEFARYSDYELTVDPDVANERITGRFSASDPKGFANAAATSLGIRVELGPTSATLYR